MAASAAGPLAARAGKQLVKPILSTDPIEARRRVLNLYKAWYRQIPYIGLEYDVPISTREGREKLRELFLRNKHVSDPRTIDLLVIKGQMELVETTRVWKTKDHIMRFFKDTEPKKPQDFLSKFFDGQP